MRGHRGEQQRWTAAGGGGQLWQSRKRSSQIFLSQENWKSPANNQESWRLPAKNMTHYVSRGNWEDIKEIPKEGKQESRYVQESFAGEGFQNVWDQATNPTASWKKEMWNCTRRPTWKLEDKKWRQNADMTEYMQHRLLNSCTHDCCGTDKLISKAFPFLRKNPLNHWGHLAMAAAEPNRARCPSVQVMATSGMNGSEINRAGCPLTQAMAAANKDPNGQVMSSEINRAGCPPTQAIAAAEKDRNGQVMCPLQQDIASSKITGMVFKGLANQKRILDQFSHQTQENRHLATAATVPGKSQMTWDSSDLQDGMNQRQRKFKKEQRMHSALSKNTLQPEEPYFLRLRKALPWWEKHAPKATVKLIQNGVFPTMPLPDYLGSKQQHHTPQEEKQALQVLQEYMQVGAVVKNPAGITRHLIPWFIISKVENGTEKLRLISDCRVINQHFKTKHFKLDHWKNIFPYLKKGMWAAKIDLKNAYFHLELANTLKPYIRVQVAGDLYEFQAACFGISTLPQLWMQVMKVFQKVWRQKGIMCFIYLDDILILNTTPHGVEKDLKFMLGTLEQAGMVVNLKKSILTPTQKLDHLGFSLNLDDGVLEVPKHKLKSVRKELGKILTHKQMTCRKMAAILGNVRSFLMAMPFLRAFTDHMMAFVNQQGHWGWDIPLEIPKTLQQEVRDLNNLTRQWNGRPFQEKTIMRQLHSDSSNHAWAGIDVQTGTVVQEFWRERNGLHINVKELEAAIQTTKSLAKPKEMVHLSVDNSVAFAYLTRGGGRLPQFNKLMRDFWTWVMENQIQVKTTLVKSQEDQADYWSRMPQDRGDYKLDRNLFLHLQTKMCKFIIPKIDMFASPGNHQLDQFVARHPHWQANRHDALKCNLEDITMCYANPPWTVIADWLNRLWDNPHVTCMMITPYWVGAPWWPLLVKMQCPQTMAYIIPPYHGMFQNCLGEYMRAPKWPLLCTVLSGKHWKPNKFKLKTLTLF